MISMVFLCSFNVGYINLSKLFWADDIVLSNKKLYDFDNGEFDLYEGEHSYAIYSNDEFLEGSNKVNSPYFGENANDKWYYLGPGNYYVAKNKMIVNILTREENVIPNMKKAKYLINDFENDSQLTKASNSSSFNKINNAYYFENLKQFPSNLDGACGIVALSILLGYYDNFYDDLFIPNNLTYDSNQVVDYGYSDDMFLVHTGWKSKTNQIMLGGATIEGYFSLKYTGSHNHSASINIFNGDGKDEKICTCGYIFTHEHTLIYEKNNSSSHLVKCSVCNEVIGTEVHKFVFNIKLDTNVCSRCGYIGSKIEEIIHGRKI